MISLLDDALFTLQWLLPLIMVCVAMALIAVLAYLARTLSVSGSLAAFVCGVIVLWSTRFEGFLLFLLFFVSCNVVGKVSRNIRKAREARVSKPLEEVQEKKGHRRDGMQVMANGLMATIAALLWLIGAKPSALVMFGASIAEATSDTFAGEIGRLSSKGPVSILTKKPVPVGVSGGVTWLGTIGAFLSSAFIAVCWYVFFIFTVGPSSVSFHGAALVCLLGFAGAIVDSYLGATIQAIYFDPESRARTEKDEIDGRKLELSRGIRWVDNDMVNLISNIFSAIFAMGMSALIG